MRAVLRYLGLYAALVRFSTSRALEFRLDFYFRFFMDIAYYAFAIAFFKLIYMQAPTFGGWREDEAMVFIALTLLIDSFYMTVAARNIWEFPHLINRGELDYYLTRPAAPLFFALLKNFEFASLLNVLLGAGVFIWATGNYQGELSALNLLVCLILVINGVLITCCLSMFSVLPVFWTQARFGFYMLYEALHRVTERPEGIFRGMTHIILVSALPFLVITSFPARAIFGDLSPLTVLHSMLVTAAMLLALRFFWGRGLAIYGSASS